MYQFLELENINYRHNFINKGVNLTGMRRIDFRYPFFTKSFYRFLSLTSRNNFLESISDKLCIKQMMEYIIDNPIQKIEGSSNIILKYPPMKDSTKEFLLKHLYKNIYIKRYK